MKKLILNGLLATAFLSPFAITDDAEAREREYCREYTKTIRVNGRKESGYGTACRQEDGSWMIVKAKGDVDPFDALRKKDVVIVAKHKPVYFRYGPRHRPVTYFVPAGYHYGPPGFYYGHGYGFYDRDWPPGWRKKHWRHHRHDNRHDDWRENRHDWNHFDDEDEDGYRQHKKH